MAYTDHFRLADDVITHLNGIIGGISDPFISSRYVGFVAVACVTVFELAIKEIFISFGQKKHKVLGEFTRQYFDRINGRIRIQTIQGEYIKRFGAKYVERFTTRLQKAETDSLRTDGVSIHTSYENLIVWRNEFAHDGQIPSTATYVEVTRAYEMGKMVIRCLADAMQR